MLGGREAGENFFIQGLALDFFDKFLDNLVIHIGFEECQTDHPQSFSHVFFCDFPFSAKIFHRFLEMIRKLIEHPSASLGIPVLNSKANPILKSNREGSGLDFQHLGIDFDIRWDIEWRHHCFIFNSDNTCGNNRHRPWDSKSTTKLILYAVKRTLKVKTWPHLDICLLND